MDILLVDDEVVILKTIGRFLVACGHQVITATHATEALRLLEEKPPDMVITDIKMPGMNGLDLLQRIQARFVSIPVILITGHGDEDKAAMALQKGAFEYLRKPIKLEKLMEVMERIKERKQLEETLLQEQATLFRTRRLDTVCRAIEGAAQETDDLARIIQGNLQKFRDLWKHIEPVLHKLSADEKDGKDTADLTREMLALVSNILTGIDDISRIVDRFKDLSCAEDNNPEEREYPQSLTIPVL